MSIKKLKQLIKKPSSTLEKLDAFLFKKYNTQYKKSNPAHKPSVVGSPCLRKIYYSYYRVDSDKPIDPRGARIFNTGDYMETMIIDWLREIDERIPYRNKSNGEIPKGMDGKPDPQFIISSKRWRIKKGKIDNVAIVDGDVWIYEIKSSKASKFEKLTGPQPDHLIQAAIYFQCFNDLYLEGGYDHVPEIKGAGKAVGIKFLYINKNTSEIKEYIIPGKALIPTILSLDKKILGINETYIDKKILPPTTKDYCFFCPFSKKCKENWNEP